MMRLSLPRPRLLRTPIRFVIIFALTVGVLHMLSRSGIITSPSKWDVPAREPVEPSEEPPVERSVVPSVGPSVGIFPASPVDIKRPATRPILVSRPHSPEGPFTKHLHQHPYPGTAHHMTTTIHPSKDNQTHYLLSSIWFFEQEGNLDWTRIGLQGLLPTSAEQLDFTCEYQRGGEGAVTEVPATTKLQGRREYVHVECPLPPWIKVSTNMSEKGRRKALESLSKDTTQIKAWIRMDGEPLKKADPWQTWRDEPIASDAITRQNSGSTYVHLATQELSTGDWEPSGPPNKLAICLSPIRLYQPKAPDSAKLVRQLKDMVEWRIWHGFGGVEVVHWTARNGNVGQWVNALNRVLGLHDTFLIAPNPVTAHDGHRKDYGDQLMYLADCFMRYGVTDEWQAMTDLDEYLLARDDPEPYWIARRVDLAPENIGTFSIEQTYHGSKRLESSDLYPPPQVDEFPSFPRNAYKDWDTMEKANGYRASKSMHRTAVVHSIWVHSVTQLGTGYWKSDDKPGIAPDKGDYPSQLELLHDRGELPKKLIIENTVNEESFGAWKGTWEDMAEMLRGPELAELWDPLLVVPRVA